MDEFSEHKLLIVVFLQGTHSDSGNKAVWGMEREGQCLIIHGSNVSAGLAVLFSLDLKLISTLEVDKGRLLVIGGLLFCFLMSMLLIGELTGCSYLRSLDRTYWGE